MPEYNRDRDHNITIQPGKQAIVPAQAKNTPVLSGARGKTVHYVALVTVAARGDGPFEAQLCEYTKGRFRHRQAANTGVAVPGTGTTQVVSSGSLATDDALMLIVANKGAAPITVNRTMARSRIATN